VFELSGVGVNFQLFDQPQQIAKILTESLKRSEAVLTHQVPSASQLTPSSFWQFKHSSKSLLKGNVWVLLMQNFYIMEVIHVLQKIQQSLLWKQCHQRAVTDKKLLTIKQKSGFAVIHLYKILVRHNSLYRCNAA